MKDIVVISDCDGVLTDGNFIYTSEGKVAKIYGPHDNDGVKMLKEKGFSVIFITADKRGFDITKKRIDDMNCPLYLVSEKERLEWIKSYINTHNFKDYIYIADGISDVPSLQNACFSIVPQNGRNEAKNIANYITPSNGGSGAFLDAAIMISDMYCKITTTTKTKYHTYMYIEDGQFLPFYRFCKG